MQRALLCAQRDHLAFEDPRIQKDRYLRIEAGRLLAKRQADDRRFRNAGGSGEIGKRSKTVPGTLKGTGRET